MLVNVLGQVFQRFQYLLLASGVAFTFVSAALLLPNRPVIVQIFTSDVTAWSAKMSFLWSIYGSLQTNFTVLTGSYLLLVGVLFGVNIALLVYYIRRQQSLARSAKTHLTSLGGMVSATFGIGCAACGSVILTAVFGLAGTGTLLAWLPLHGLEFGVVGIVLLWLSIYYLTKRISDPLVCSVHATS
jgi:hypothetical protein